MTETKIIFRSESAELFSFLADGDDRVYINYSPDMGRANIDTLKLTEEIIPVLTSSCKFMDLAWKKQTLSVKPGTMYITRNLINDIYSMSFELA